VPPTAATVDSGVGQGRGSYPLTGASVLLALLVLPMLWFSPLPTVAAGLVAMAFLQRNPYLAFWAAVFGVLGTLEQFFVLSNRLDGIAGELGQPAVFAGLGVLLLIAGLVARHREDGAR
jgi:hypothetical protein